MIEVCQLTKKFGDRVAVDHISFSVASGEIVGFLGPNGAGKSTTMKMLTAFIPATEGTAYVNGHEVFESPAAVKASIGYLPEIPPIYSDMTVEKYLRFVATIQGLEPKKQPSAIDEALERAGLVHMRGRLIGNLSKGYRQRVGISQALVHKPAVLILDEPTSGLDPVQVAELRGVVKGLAKDHTVLLSSHILPEVTQVCDRVLVINEGHLVADNTIEGLQARLSGDCVYEISFETAPTDVVPLLEGFGGVSSVQRRDGIFSVGLCDDNGETTDQLLSEITGRGWGVRSFSKQKSSLEEIFVHLTTSEETAAE